MTWRRLTRAQADAEARAAWLEGCRIEREHRMLLLNLFAEEEADREARLEASRPMLHGMTSADLLDILHDCYEHGTTALPCDKMDVLTVVVDEVGRRRAATGHERIRLRQLDRTA